MRLSDIPGDRAFDVLADCIEPVASIMGDEELSGQLQELSGKSTAEQMKVLVLVLRNHKDDVLAILGATEGQSAKAYAKSHNMAQVISDALAILTDEQLLGFMPAVEQASTSLGDASANTKVQEA